MIAGHLLDAKALSGLVWVAASDSVAEAAQRMKAHGIGCLLVGDGGPCMGVLTERDVITRAVAVGVVCEDTPVREIMTAPIVCCSVETPLNEVQETMVRHRVRHLPVLAGDRVVGLLSSRDLMQHVSGYERRLRELTIFSMAKLAESRDTETGNHLERVRDYVEALARWLSQRPDYQEIIDEEFVALLRTTSALHDIGKVSIPDCILLKPGRLSGDEFELMKTHTLAGAETLGEALREFPEARFLQMGHDIAAYHHERVDGKGYPEGLRDESIPLCARIFTLADVYDALVSRRVYKRALPHSLAREIITSGAGTQFDENIVQGFFACADRFHAIQQSYAAEQAAA